MFSLDTEPVLACFKVTGSGRCSQGEVAAAVQLTSTGTWSALGPSSSPDLDSTKAVATGSKESR